MLKQRLAKAYLINLLFFESSLTNALQAPNSNSISDGQGAKSPNSYAKPPIFIFSYGAPALWLHFTMGSFGDALLPLEATIYGFCCLRLLLKEHSSFYRRLRMKCINRLPSGHKQL